MSQALDEHGTRLRDIDGIGPVTAARLIGRTGRPDRFPTAAAYANYNGSASVQIASADTDRHRLSRYGDRQLENALYTVAMVQTRIPAVPAEFLEREKRSPAVARASHRPGFFRRGQLGYTAVSARRSQTETRMFLSSTNTGRASAPVRTAVYTLRTGLVAMDTNCACGR